MGQFISPLDGQTFVHGSTIDITYQIDTQNFGTLFSEIYALQYHYDNVYQDTETPPAATAPAQYTWSVTLPSTGTTLNLKVEAWNIAGVLQPGESSDIDLILTAAPAITCTGTDQETTTSLRMNGTAAGTLTGGGLRLVYGTTASGPYPNIVNLINGNGTINHTVTGLSANTIYYYRIEALDIAGNVIAQSGECSGTTSNVVVPPTPSNNGDTQLVKLCTIVGTQQVCDGVSGDAILLVHVSASDGDIIPTDSTEFPAPTNSGVFSTIGFFRSYFADLNGNLLVPQPTTVKICQPSAETQTASILATCDDIGNEEITYGSDLLINGDFTSSSGTGATSSNGPGWITNYAPAGNIYAAGATTYAFFTTNAGSVTGGNAIATGVVALTGRSMAVNVGPNTTIPIIRWNNIYLENGVSYTLKIDAAILNNPFSIAIKVDTTVVAAVTPPVAVGVWTTTDTTFTYTGATGYHSVGLYSNTGAAGGNDHAFDNISLRRVIPASVETRTDVEYTGVTKAILEQIVETTGCADDRRDNLLGQILNRIVDIAYVTPICVANVTVLRITRTNGTNLYLSTNGQLINEPAAYTIGACPVTMATTNITTEVYRLSGIATPATSTASTGPTSNPVVGNTVTIAPPFKALSWNFLRETAQDFGNGSTARVEINGFAYHAGNGPVYQTVGHTLQANANESFNSSWKFDVFGNAFIEIVVIR